MVHHIALPPPEKNARIEILANFPDKDVPVKFSYATEEAKGFITGVKVGDEDVTNYNDADFTVKSGSKVTITGNTNDYNLKSLTVNGQPVYFYGQYQFTVLEETEIAVDASKYAMLSATLNIDNPDNVTVYRGSTYQNDIITGLAAGSNTIEVSEKSSTISITANSGCYITSVTTVVGEGDDAVTETISEDYNKTYSINVTEGMVITVASGAITRDKTAVIYIDDITKASDYKSFSLADRSTVEIASGYNVFDFYDALVNDGEYATAEISFYGPDLTVAAYKNDETFEPKYANGTSFSLGDLADGDIVKFFLAGTPAKYNVTFEVNGEGTGEDITVTRDIIKAVENWKDGFSTLQGTKVSIKAAEDSKVTVAVDEQTLTADENGEFTFTVNADTGVKLTYPVDTGISGILSGNVAGKADIYSLQGIMVKKGATAADADKLPAGVYIINGKKVVKR